ncbi:MAG: mannose-1-phosphate guanylyltransferase/mannose-6-phosphate isomerase [Candidatus Accumulibacter sp.]|jgi:mannose-1-phosphate guanylyltransferase/mannose-6-phosphate isomerase|nr:mannose-1-phosphate guanylyltransferase/mannose-6-phosphate isomerase [Accumulibacter sp.]
MTIDAHAPDLTTVILCGGSGTRLWPLSRKSLPKQFVPLIGDKSLLQMTLERAVALSPGLPPILVAADEHRFTVTGILHSANTRGDILLEPTARNTAAAIAISALHARRQGRDMLLFCPADHHIPDTAAFLQSIRRGCAAALSGAIVTFGVCPSFPSAAYGYIRRGQCRDDGVYDVERFIEKPDVETARELLLSNTVFWNAGIFLARSGAILAAMEKHAPDILGACQAAMDNSTRDVSPDGYLFVRPETGSFMACRSQSIDYAVMEPHRDIAVTPLDGQWSDVGSWDAVARLAEADENGNKTRGQAWSHLAKNTFIYAPYRPVVALGTRDLLLVDTPDAVLVAHRDAAEQVKDVVARLEENHCAQALAHRKVARPWGWYDTIDTGERFLVKRIGVKPGASLSLQKHVHRAEHWVVVRGCAEVVRADETFRLNENQSAYIPMGVVHRLKNPGDAELEIIEVQSGDYLGEDDIIRLEDIYGRETPSS